MLWRKTDSTMLRYAVSQFRAILIVPTGQGRRAFALGPIFQARRGGGGAHLSLSSVGRGRLPCAVVAVMSGSAGTAWGIQSAPRECLLGFAVAAFVAYYLLNVAKVSVFVIVSSFWLADGFDWLNLNVCCLLVEYFSFFGLSVDVMNEAGFVCEFVVIIRGFIMCETMITGKKIESLCERGHRFSLVGNWFKCLATNEYDVSLSDWNNFEIIIFRVETFKNCLFIKIR